MPVIVETFTAASEQDLSDLRKIYADAPAWLLPPYADAEALIHSGLAAGTLVAGRFNDRLLGAALLQETPEGWQLSHLCVRRITRNRGVASRLVGEARQRAEAAGYRLILRAPASQLEARGWAVRLGLPLEDTQA